jgi:hypothetical protein
MTEIDGLARRLVAARFSPKGPLPVAPGVYAWFLKKPEALASLGATPDQPVYVGMTADAAGNRNHFDMEDSGWSSPRRSLGALLKDELELTAIPRSDGNCTNYRFAGEGEAVLTAWMRRNLLMSHIPLDGGKAAIKEQEGKLIDQFQPPLNLQGVPGDREAQRELKRLRKFCADEARSRLAGNISTVGKKGPTIQQLTDAIDTLVNLVRSVYLKRALTKVERNPELNFWRVMYGNLLDVAVVEWCKLFGSDSEHHQHVHWKNVFRDQKSFRAGLLRHVGVTRKAWDAYWNEMKTYRDMSAVHLDSNRRTKVPRFPELGQALTSSAYYYGKAVEELRRRGVGLHYPDDLKAYGEQFFAQAIEIAEKALAATKNIRDRVR